MDLKKIADETKAQLPGILDTIPNFNATESSLHHFEDIAALDQTNCPGFKTGTRIRVLDMDTLDVALSLNPDYKVHTRLGLATSTVNQDTMGSKDENVTISKSDIDLSLSDPGLKEDMNAKTSHDGDTIMENLVTTEGVIQSDKSGASELDTDTTPTPPFTVPTHPVAVLNLASERSPGGGWQNGALAQEECLCYRSSLYLSLHKAYYPIPSLSAIYTPNVVLIRDAMARGHTLLTPTEHPTNLPALSVISVAALRHPALTDDGEAFKNEGARAETKRKIRLTLRVAAKQGHTKLVLGALGCGVFANPPKEVAECFLEVLWEKEFQGGWWEDVAFAVLDNVSRPDGGIYGEGNFGQFHRVLDGQAV
ncbi:hypothetical protein EJ02DRAFT_460767 [Clathrospora elynae]|uniref:Microbial-type PARG catalytic domain-containing protein n=1 Tax=Clathrospora elynae TaxID=706981 RepID=A0A6A5S5V7_9PLEO|nr:hypothetical protein EJ02DRAFT_460767 [Clathrospora elynae]